MLNERKFKIYSCFPVSKTPISPSEISSISGNDYKSSKCTSSCLRYKVSKRSYPELQVLHPLSDHLVLRGAGVGHLELEQVVASGGVPVLIKHNRGVSAACRTEDRKKDTQVSRPTPT